MHARAAGIISLDTCRLYHVFGRLAASSLQLYSRNPPARSTPAAGHAVVWFEPTAFPSAGERPNHWAEQHVCAYTGARRLWLLRS